jgi:hypothetical protein
MTAGIRQNMRSKSLILSYFGLIILLTGAVVLLFSFLFFRPETASGDPDGERLSEILTAVMYLSCLIGLGMQQNIFSFMPLTRAKSRGSIQSLLAAPVTPRELWLGKSLSVWVPGLIVGELLALVTFVGFNVIFLISETGFLFTVWMGLTVFLLLPLLYLGLCLLVHLVGLIGKTANGNMIAQIFFPASGALMTNLIIHRSVDADGLTFTLLNAGIAALLFLLVFLVQPSLTAEKIVLSEGEDG